MSGLRQRLGGAAGGGGAPLAGGGDPLRRLKKLDIYRKVPRDLTEGSAAGGMLTAVAIVLLFVLTIAELRSLAQIHDETELVVDRSEDGAFRINLNLTVLGLSCEFLSVDLKNALGSDREDLNDETLHKYATDDKSSWVGSATKKLPPQIHTYEISPGAKDHYGNERHAIELDKKSFEEALNDYEVLLVDFHSPRCIHCVKFAPIWEIAAGLVKERAPGKGSTLDTHRKYSVALATVDCIQNIELCRARHIQAYPTVHVYRQPPGGAQNQAKPSGGILGGYFDTNKDHLYEVYHGPRDAEAIATFALKVLDEVLVQDPTLGKNAFVGPSTDVEGDGRPESTVHAAGCRVEGYLDVRRVPGSVIIRPHSRDDAHDFDTGLVNVDHRIDHLSFGHRMTLYSDDGPYSQSDSAATPVVVAPGETVNGFKAREKGFAHAHFVKVVSKTTVPLGRPSVQAYEYSIASDSFRSKNGIPYIEIAFDLSPLQIRVVETRRDWIEGITAMLALIGGLFSASFIIEGLLSSFTTWMAADAKRA